MKTRAAMIVFFAILTQCASPDTDLSSSEYHAFTAWDAWPILQIGTRTYMRSTYDRLGGNDDADASHFLRQDPEGFVALDVVGNGSLEFFRANHWHGSPWHFVVDGTDTVVRETNTADPDHPKSGATWLPSDAFPSPLALTSDVTHGADVSWVRVPFVNRLTIAYERTDYGTGYFIYRMFPEGEGPATSWDRAAPPSDVAAIFASAGSDVAPAGESHAGTLDGATTTLADLEGSGTIRAVKLVAPRASASALATATIRMTWDDRAAPSVDCPLALFFGTGTFFNRDGREWIVKSAPVSVRYPPASDAIELAAYFPMPFAAHAKLEITSPTPIDDVHFEVRVLRDPPQKPFGYFHASYIDQGSGIPGRDLVMLDTRGVEGAPAWCGHVIGTTVSFSDHGALGTLEGDPRFFFDESGTPQIQGTGSEEWGGGGDYFDNGALSTLPFAGHPVGVPGDTAPIAPQDGIESLYRFLLGDAMPFGERAVVGIEHGGLDDSSEHYRTVAYWYGRPDPCLVLSDAIHIGDDADEAAHVYSAVGGSSPVSITSRYEVGVDHDLAGNEVIPETTDSGRVITGSSEMTLTIPSDNAGVMLRRKLDYALPDQRADVFVDGERAGTWYLAGSTTSIHSNPHTELGPPNPTSVISNRRFRDDEFLIPRRLTTGKSKIRVRFAVQTAWSEMRVSAWAWIAPN